MIADPVRPRPGSHATSRDASARGSRPSDAPGEARGRRRRRERAAYAAARAFGFAVVLGAFAFVAWGWLSILL